VPSFGVPPVHKRAELRGLSRRQHAGDLLDGSIQSGVNPRLHRPPARIHISLMANKNLVDGVLLRRSKVQVAGQTMEQSVNVGGDGLMSPVVRPLVEDAGRNACAEDEREE